MQSLITTKPGEKYRSIKRPRVYEALRRRGYSKEQAARISNAQARRKSYTLDQLERFVGSPAYDPAIAQAIALGIPELPRLKGEQISPGVTRIRGNLCNVHGRYGPCDAALSGKKPAPKPKKGRARKPAKAGGGKAPAKTPEQRAQERTAAQSAEQTKNRDAVKQAMADGDQGLAPAGFDNLMALGAGTEPDQAGADGLLKMGMAERGADGTLRLTAAGRAAISAANRGDAKAAIDAVSRGAEQATKLGAKKPEKPAKGGGGGGSKKPSPEDKKKRQTQERAHAAQATASQVGLAADDLAVLQAAAEGGQAAIDGAKYPAVVNKLLALGLVTEGDETATTDQGRRALSALERGDVRGYRAALQDAQARLGRESAAETRRTEADTRREQTTVARTARQQAAEARRRQATADRAKREAERVRRRREPKVKSFTVFKDARGAWRWVAQSSTAYQDRDREIVSTKALADDVARADADGHYGPLRWWHVPGLDLGMCDFNAMIGRVLVESGTFKSEAIARKVAAHAPDLELSLGFLHPPTDPDPHGVFHTIRRFERSLTPRGKASNLFTSFRVKGNRPMDETKKAALKQLGFSDTDIAGLEATAAATEKAADAQGVAFKAQEPQQELTIGGVTYLLTEKAPPPPPAETVAEPVAVVEEQALDDPMAEEPYDDTAVTLSAGDLEAITQAIGAAVSQALAPLAGMLDIEKKMSAHVQSVMQGYQTTKDASDAERAQEIATLQASLKATQDKLAELTGDQPAVPYRASEAMDNLLGPDGSLLAAIKSQQPNVHPFEDLTNHIIGNLAGNGFAPPS